MAVMQLGQVQFDIAPMNLHELSHDATAGFAEHQVVGIRPPLEFVGPGPEQWTIKGMLLPKHFPGSLEAMDTLQAMRIGGQPQAMFRSDGVPFGWVVITHIQQRSTRIAADGVGRIIEFDVTVKLSDAPTPGVKVGALLSLFF